MALDQIQTNMLGNMSSINGGPLAGFRNMIMNGRMDLAQRGPGPFTAAGYTLDRWRIKQPGTGSTVAVAPGTINNDEFPNCLKADRTTTGSTGFIIEQPIEGVRSLTGKTVTVSFYASCANGISLGVSLAQNFGTGGSSEVAVTTQNQVLTTTPTRYSFTFSMPSITGKTVGTDHYTGLRFNVSQTQGNFSDLKITGVQVEVGKAATPFEHRFEGTELALCQRYYSTSYPEGDAPGTVYAAARGYGLYGSGNVATYATVPFQIVFPVQMRKIPTYTLYSHTGVADRWSEGSTNNVNTFSVNARVETNQCLAVWGDGATNGYDGYLHYTADAEIV